MLLEEKLGELKAKIGGIMVTIKTKGDFRKLNRFLEKAKTAIHVSDLDRFGKEGVAALQSATPIDTGKTSESWFYRIVRSPGVVKIQFLNSNIQDGVPIAIILQMGHGTRNGGWVEGVDYINPSIRPIFNQIVEYA